MVKVSERIKAIANYVNQDDVVADIGTDHGLLPIYLYMKGVSRKFILSDINESPLEAARANLNAYVPFLFKDLRLGDGLLPYNADSADAVVIAGIGGREIISILAHDLTKTKSFTKFILQPRNAQSLLRKWLYENGLNITAESLVREGPRICEIIVAVPFLCAVDVKGSWYKRMEENLSFEISPLLFKSKDPLLSDFLSVKINIEENIKENIIRYGQETSLKQAEQSCARLGKLRSLLQQVEQQGRVGS